MNECVEQAAVFPKEEEGKSAILFRVSKNPKYNLTNLEKIEQRRAKKREKVSLFWEENDHKRIRFIISAFIIIIKRRRKEHYSIRFHDDDGGVFFASTFVVVVVSFFFAFVGEKTKKEDEIR